MTVAVRTTCRQLSTGQNRRLPAMTLCTAPPDLSPRPRQYLLRREGSVLLRIPFCYQRWIQCRKGVLLRQHRPPRTIGAAGALYSGFDCRAIGMSPFTAPPDESMAAYGHVRRREGSILLRIPLLCQGGRPFCQRVDARQGTPPRTVRAAASRGAGIYPRLPAMTVRAAPPDLLPRAIGYVLGRERRIFLVVPLGQQNAVSMFRAEVVKRLPNRRSPPANRPFM